jgi:hypothetical protein
MPPLIPVSPTLLARLREPSSYLAVGAWLAAAGYNIPEPWIQGLAFILAGVASIAAFFLPEGGKPQ